MNNSDYKVLLSAWGSDVYVALCERTDRLDLIIEIFGLEMPDKPMSRGLDDEICREIVGKRQSMPTITDLRGTVRRLEELKGCNAVRNLMNRYGIERLSSLDREAYASFIKDAEELINEPC